MREINFMTISDDSYFIISYFSAKQLLKFYPQSRFFIYDWGLTNTQKQKILSISNTIIIDWNPNLNRERGGKTISDYEPGSYIPDGDYKTKEYLLNQKPFCILDCAYKINKNIIFLDGDAFLCESIDEIFELNIQLGVTIHSKRNTEILSKKFNQDARLNSGVIFFLMDNHLIQLIIKEWIEEIKRTKIYLMEQTALLNLIKKKRLCLNTAKIEEGLITFSENQIKLKNFSTNIYNYNGLDSADNNFNPYNIKIFHFTKYASWKYMIRKNIFELKFYIFYSKLISIIPSFLRKRISYYYFFNLIKKIADFRTQKNGISKIIQYLSKKSLNIFHKNL